MQPMNSINMNVWPNHWVYLQVYLLYCSYIRKGVSSYMMMDATILFQIAGIGIITALIHTVLKQVGKEDIAQFVSLVGFIIVLVIVIHHLNDLFQQIKTIFLLHGITLGILYI